MSSTVTYPEICEVFTDPDTRMKLLDVAQNGNLSQEAFQFIKDVMGSADRYNEGFSDGFENAKEAASEAVSALTE